MMALRLRRLGSIAGISSKPRLAPGLARLGSSTAEFAELEHRNWQKAVHAYDQGWGSLTRQCIPELLTGVGCQRGCRLVDVATGPGFVAEEAAKAGADVVTVDFARNMVDLARARLAKSLGLESVQCVEADAASMPFDAETFDAVACSFGVLHLPEPEAFFTEALRILRPGGRLGFTVWAPTPSTEALALVHTAVQQHGNPNVPLPEAPPFFRFADAADTAQTLSAVGFGEIVSKQVAMCWEVKDARETFVAFRDGTGRTAALLAGQSPEQLQAIEAAITEGTEAKRSGPDQSCRLQMPCILTLATKR
ncbi:menG [Symbiodinium microadriaticum]|nr:menG [Symbiodinium microadriaticum]